MQKKIYLAFILIFPFYLMAQNINTTEYKISMIGNSQEIYLIKENDNYSGFIISSFYKPSKRFLGLTLRKHEALNIKTDLDSDLVKKTMSELKNMGIDNLQNCEENIDCNKINFLDPDFLVFDIKNGDSISSYKFKEVYPENNSKDIIEKNAIRRTAQILITVINENLDLKTQFKFALRKMKKPYCYDCGGISSCCVK
ncbi:hypothetical protein [Flavobacterium luminosum]|uniref:Uncharacterized protein n=1 Tax=Flavobacterium luminosum TaxID=2949086 RepID=A0ABT0TQL6_9FLAO|nr:hypothetical protein [Flavobacterium sp. HXWNR70]MCL9809786.1 hypothetical protein [Flavobacterium sp. HXWNR70]